MAGVSRTSAGTAAPKPVAQEDAPAPVDSANALKTRAHEENQGTESAKSSTVPAAEPSPDLEGLIRERIARLMEAHNEQTVCNCDDATGETCEFCERTAASFRVTLDLLVAEVSRLTREPLEKERDTYKAKLGDWAAGEAMKQLLGGEGLSYVELEAHTAEAERKISEVTQEREEGQRTRMNQAAIIAKLRTDLAEKERQLQEAQALNRRSMCTYCGEIKEHADPETRFNEMAQHILSCEKHPVRLVLAKIEEAKRETWEKAIKEVECLPSGSESWRAALQSVLTALHAARSHEEPKP